VAFLVKTDPPCILFEDDHLLAVNKPPGMNTHAPSPFAGEGIYDWLRHREPRWADLAIIHRLDKETSGVLVFAKTPLACKSLTDQFTWRDVRKQYVLATDHPVREERFQVTSSLRRQGDRYISLPVNQQDPVAETQFELAERRGPTTWLYARPLTGRTHQIRVHAAARGLPIVGDSLYRGTPAARLWLHAAKLALRHPVSGEPIQFAAPDDLATPPWIAQRRALIDEPITNAWRWRHGASDGVPGAYVEQWADYLLILSDSADPEDWRGLIAGIQQPSQGVYRKTLNRQVRRTVATEACPQWLAGATVPEEFEITENGVRYAIRFSEGYSTGLFLDQRDNRRRLLRNYAGRDFPLWAPGLAGAAVLNTFAYTCGFSVCAAKAGARTASVDLSRKYLEWGRRNFALNDLPLEGHEFLYGDAFDWLRRLRKKGRRFHVVLLDPPTFSSSRESGVFQAQRDYPRLVEAAAPLIEPGGALFCSTNAAQVSPEDFLEFIDRGLRTADREAKRRLYIPQPPDFPISKAEPAYLKTVWIQVK
jgi:23S rRNA (cytosine1962-C5)-methyltransferase